MIDGITPKDKLDAEIELMKLAWSSFDRRREFEWKFTLALWTGLSAFIGIFLTRQVPDNVAIPIGASAAALFVFFGHLNFSLGLGRANNADRRLQYFYEREIRDMIGVTWPDEVTASFAALKKHMGVITNFSHTQQITVTFILCVGSACAAWIGYMALIPATP